LRERWVIVVTSTVVAVGAALAYTTLQAPPYESTAVLQLLWEDEVIGEPVLPELDTSASAVTSDEVNARVAELIGGEAGALADLIGVSFDPENQRLLITATSPDGRIARQVTDAYATSFVADLQAQVNAEVATLEERRALLAKEITKYQDELADDKEDQLVQTQLNGALQSYSRFSTEIEAATFAGPPAEVVTPATEPQSTALSRRTVVMVAALIGLLAGVGLALVRNEFDTRIRHARNIRAVTDVPLLAEVPRDRDGSARGHFLPVVAPELSPFTNGIRALRTAIQVFDSSSGLVIVVTSPEPGEGKTYIAANLAASFALSGKQTMLVSGDLRQPELDKYFPSAPATPRHPRHPRTHNRSAAGQTQTNDAPEAEGEPPATDRALTPVRTARTTTALPHEDISAPLRPTRIDNLLFYAAITSTGDPADLLATPLIDDLIADLRMAADIVIVDSPPVLAVADPLILGRYADGIVIITMTGKTTLTALTQTIEKVQADKIPLVGIALNGVKSRADQSYSRYFSAMHAGQPAPS
jgi:tyrosine-protein kinase Etk/Wzc